MVFYFPCWLVFTAAPCMKGKKGITAAGTMRKVGVNTGKEENIGRIKETGKGKKKGKGNTKGVKESHYGENQFRNF